MEDHKVRIEVAGRTLLCLIESWKKRRVHHL